jgi:hypothetical protein
MRREVEGCAHTEMLPLHMCSTGRHTDEQREQTGGRTDGRRGQCKKLQGKESDVGTKEYLSADQSCQEKASRKPS